MCDGRIQRSQRLPRNPANGQVPTWNSATNQWVAADGSGLPDGTNADDILLWDAVGLTWYSSTSPFTNRDLNEAINGQWDFRNALTYTGGIIDPFGVSSPSSGFTTGADIDGHLFYKNSLGAIMTFRTASVSSDVIYDLPTETGTLALRGKTGIHFDADANVSASLQVLKDPANNSLPIQVSSSQIGMAFSGVTNPIVWRANGTLTDYSGWHQADGTYRFLTKDGAQLFVNTVNGIIFQNGLGSSGRTSIDGNNNWNIGGSFTNAARLHVRGDGTNPIVRFESSVGTSRLSIDNAGVAVFTNTVETTDINLSAGQRAISSSTGYVLLTTNYSGTFTGLRFGGTGIANPMIKRNGTAIDIRLADDSGFAALNAEAITASSFISSSTFLQGNTLRLTGGGRIVPVSDGVFTLTNIATTDFGRLQLGGTSNLFPAIKRNGAGIDIRLADDTGFAALGAASLAIAGYGFAALSTRFYIDQDARNVAFGASVSIKGGNTAADATSILDVASTSKGVLIPRMTSVQRDAIVAPAESLLIYNTTTRQFNYWNTVAWKALLTD